MGASVRLVSVQDAYDDLLQRTLSRIPCEFGRLIYLASTRDYNSGTYHHEGLAARFQADTARKALEIAHRQVFYAVSAYSLEELVSELEKYLQTSRENPEGFLRAWQKLEPYRVAVPVETDSLSSEFLFSNFKVALAILEARLHPARAAAAA